MQAGPVVIRHRQMRLNRQPTMVPLDCPHLGGLLDVEDHPWLAGAEVYRAEPATEPAGVENPRHVVLRVARPSEDDLAVESVFSEKERVHGTREIEIVQGYKDQR
jgi:hypothetical protein